MNETRETPLFEIIKNRIDTYKINRIDIIHTKKALKEELSEYLNRPLDDIIIGDDSIDIVVDSLDREQLDKICDLFDNVNINNFYGDQLKICVDIRGES